MTILDKIKEKSKSLKIEIVAIFLSMKDNRTPLLAKVMVVLTVSYAFSPIDIIPDFIPVLGYLDDLIILPLMLTATIKLIPPEVLSECRILVKDKTLINKKIGIFAGIVILFMWIGIIGYVLKRIFWIP